MAKASVRSGFGNFVSPKLGLTEAAPALAVLATNEVIIQLGLAVNPHFAQRAISGATFKIGRRSTRRRRSKTSIPWAMYIKEFGLGLGLGCGLAGR